MMRQLPFRLHGILAIGTALLFACPAHAQAPQPGLGAAPELVTLEDAESMQQQQAEQRQDAAENATAAWQGSLMFAEDRVADLMAIYHAYLGTLTGGQPQAETGTTRNVLEDALKLLNEPEEISQEIFSFTLNSILYDNADEWSIWVNGQRHKRKEALEGFSLGGSAIMVTDVTKQRITFVWTPNPRIFSEVLARWEAHERAKEQAKEQGGNPRIAQDSRVEMDSIGQKVTVTLRPNQTFLSAYMTVMEGARSLHPAPIPASQANTPAEAREIPQPALRGPEGEREARPMSQPEDNASIDEPSPPDAWPGLPAP